MDIILFKHGGHTGQNTNFEGHSSLKIPAKWPLTRQCEKYDISLLYIDIWLKTFDLVKYKLGYLIILHTHPKPADYIDLVLLHVNINVLCFNNTVLSFSVDLCRIKEKISYILT